MLGGCAAAADGIRRSCCAAHSEGRLRRRIDGSVRWCSAGACQPPHLTLALFLRAAHPHPPAHPPAPQVNSAPFSDGWFMKVKIDQSKQLDNLMDPAAYEAHCEAGGH